MESGKSGVKIFIAIGYCLFLAFMIFMIVTLYPMTGYGGYRYLDSKTEAQVLGIILAILLGGVFSAARVVSIIGGGKKHLIIMACKK